MRTGGLKEDVRQEVALEPGFLKSEKNFDGKNRKVGNAILKEQLVGRYKMLQVHNVEYGKLFVVN